MRRTAPKYKIEIQGAYHEYAEVTVNGQRTHRIRGKSGGYRLVAAFDGLIIKVDHRVYQSTTYGSYDVYSQTKLELDAYKKITRADRKYFPKILAHGSVLHQGVKCCWLIEPEYQRGEGYSLSDENKPIIRRLINKYDLDDLDNSDTPDDYCNWMLTVDNKIMIYDFAL